MGDSLTNALDVIGLLALAVGVGWLITDATNPGLGFIAAGLILLLGSFLAALAGRPQRRRGDE